MRRWLLIALCALAGETSLALRDGTSSQARSQEPAKPAPAAQRQAGGQLLESARTLIRQQRYRAAETLLLARLRGTPQEPLEALEATLGEVYFRSGQDEKALLWLSRAMAHYERRTPTLGTLEEQSRAADLLADTYSREGKHSDAIITLQQMYARYNHQDRVDPAVQLALIGRFARLGATDLARGFSSATLDTEVAWLAERLQADRQRLNVAGEDYVDGVLNLAKYQSQKRQFRQAAVTLERLISWCDTHHYRSDSISLRVRLAQVHRESGDSNAEIAALEAALRLQQDSPPATTNGDSTAAGESVQQSYDTAELQRRLADALFRGKQRIAALQQLEAAVHNYQSAREQLRVVPPEEAEHVEISDTLLLERLVELGERLLGSERPGNVSLQDSIRWHEELLANCEQSLLPNDPRIGRLNVSLAGLYLENSQFDLVRSKLTVARAYWTERRPLDAFMLVQTLTLVGESNLAVASRDALQEAAEALAEAAKLCSLLPTDDELRWWVRLNLGRLKAAQGHYREALDDLDRIVVQPGRALSPRLRSLALLYLGLLYKEQLQLDEALKLCRQALELRDAELAVDDPERLRYYSALAELHIARYDVVRHDDQSLRDVIQSAEKACGRLSRDHPSRTTLRHQQAMLHYMSDERTSDVAERQAAREIWEPLAATCQRTGQRAMQARALHYLARLDYLEWTAEAKAWIQRLHSDKPGDEDAEFQDLKSQITRYNRRQQELDQSRLQYRQALEKYNRSSDEPLAARQAAFRSLETMYAAVEHEQKSLDDVAEDLSQRRTKLLKAHDAAVSRRSVIAPNDRQRWQDLLVHGEHLSEQALVLLQDAYIYPSLHHAALCNQAQLFQAQSQLGIDSERLVDRAVESLQKAAAIIEDPRAATFAGDFMRAEFFAQYQSAFDLLVQLLVQADQPAKALVTAEQGRSRTLLDQLWPEKLAHRFPAERAARIVEQWRVSDQPLLYYYIGDTTSYLFVLGGQRHEIQIFPLKAAAGSGMAGSGNAASGTYIADLVRQIAGTLREERTARQITDNPLIAQTVASASAVVLPPEAAAYLQRELARGTDSVTVVPHESLAQLPLEALLVATSAGRSYLVDYCPPLVYGPSLMVLDDLAQHEAASPIAPRVLSLGNPDYAPPSRQGSDSSPAQQQRFRPLPETEDECRAIVRSFAERFGADSATLLLQAAATEGRFRADVANNRFTFLHLAAHGVVGDDRGEPFGRIALAPPASPPYTKADDGFLELEEIRNLNLAGCELAVLGACNTNLGAAVARQYKRQEGDSDLLSARRNAALRLSQTDSCFSLAAAFLAAGSCRVLATQWEVADPSTSALITLYFDKIARDLGRGRAVNYARLLADARRELRSSRPEFDTPFHWAPFVLIGPAQAAKPL